MPEPRKMGLNLNAAACSGDVWLAAPRSLPLPDDEIHLWRANMEAFATHETMLTGLLSEAELEKANRFRQKPDRNRSILARAALRDILGRYMDMDPRCLEFLVTERGKPVLNPDVHANAPHFSVSHSGDIVLLAFARKHPVGVDVETVRNDLGVIEIAQRFFAADEFDELLALPETSRVRAFFDGWTRKEAYLKARGEGIGYGLERFAVTLAPGEPARLISDERYPQEVASWRLLDIALGPDHAGATAIRCISSLRTRHWVWGNP